MGLPQGSCSLLGQHLPRHYRVDRELEDILITLCFRCWILAGLVINNDEVALLVHIDAVDFGIDLDLAVVRQGQLVRFYLLLKKYGFHSLFPEHFLCIEEALRDNGEKELLVAAVAEGVGHQGAVIGSIG